MLGNGFFFIIFVFKVKRINVLGFWIEGDIGRKLVFFVVFIVGVWFLFEERLFIFFLI